MKILNKLAECKQWIIRIFMHRFDLVYMTPFYWIPRLFKTGAGYSGKNKGIAVGWIGLMYQIRKPINER